MFIYDDFMNAWRGLRHSPGFLALASLVLALGLGATIFTYGVLNTTTQKPPPFPNADRLYAIFSIEPFQGPKYEGMPILDYVDIAEQQHTFEDFGGFYTGTVIIAGDRKPERYTGGVVSWNFMRVLGQKPLIGRDFEPSDDLASAEPVTILSYELWRSRYNEDPAIIGRQLRVNARTTTVIGVMPKGFAYPSNESLWIPIATDRAQIRRGDQSYESTIGIQGIGRVKPGVTLQQASDDIKAISTRLAKLFPRTNEGLTTKVVPIAAANLGNDARVIYSMFAAVWLVLLIACANVASLIFVRANFRVYEASMRVALGARRPRLILQMLAESLIISVLGVCGGIVIAALGLHLMALATRGYADLDPPIWWTFSIDLNVVLFAGGTAVLAAVLSGIVPALRASRPDIMRILRDGGRTGTGMRLSKFTGTMVIVEIALAAALLTGAGLMTRSAVISLQRDYGASVDGFMSARVGLPLAKYPKEAQGEFFTRLVAELRGRPGVQAAVVSTAMPGAGAEYWRFAIEGKAYENRADYPRAQTVTVTPGMFDAFQRPLLKGRDFDNSDKFNSPGVAIVNEALVRRYFPNQNPIGQRVTAADLSGDHKPITIIGVAPNINHALDWDAGDFAPTLYRPVAQEPWRFMTVAIRVQGDPTPYGKTLRDAVQHLDADLAPYWVETLRQYQEQKRGGLLLLAHVFSAYAAIAIVLAAVGIYGVLAFATGQRNREIGVRRALGAHDRQILGAVMSSAAAQLLFGLGIGALLAPLMGRVVQGGLLGLPPDDPMIYFIVFALLIVAALLASWIPARRALRVQPATALRCE